LTAFSARAVARMVRGRNAEIAERWRLGQDKGRTRLPAAAARRPVIRP
jgi:hypothetical protein